MPLVPKLNSYISQFPDISAKISQRLQSFTLNIRVAISADYRRRMTSTGTSSKIAVRGAGGVSRLVQGLLSQLQII